MSCVFLWLPALLSLAGLEAVRRHLEGKTIRKMAPPPERAVNFVAKQASGQKSGEKAFCFLSTDFCPRAIIHFFKTQP